MSHPAPETIYNEVFVSYSRKNKEFAKHLVQAIYDSGRENIWIDWEDIEYAEDWWEKIQAGIESAYNFIFILTPDSVQSEVCYKEIQHAVKSGKRIIPIVHIEITDKANFEKMHPTISKHNWLPFKAEDDFDEGMKQLIETIETDLAHVRFHTRLQTRAREWEQLERNEAYLLSTGELTEAQAWLARAELEDKTPLPTQLHRDYINASQVAEEKRQAEAERIAHRVANFRRASIGLGIVTVIAVIATIVAAIVGFNAQKQITELAAIIPGATQGARWEAWASQLDIGARNRLIFDDGAVFEHGFDGVMMVFVPAGCFMMGDGGNDVHEQCLEAFWIDKYEVSNEQYGSLGCEEYSSEPDQPRNCVTWHESLAHCQSRGGTLPAEAQWEYAARGPDSLLYPWGNVFVPDNVVYLPTSNNKTAPVGSRRGGVSWVGAYDMSGNVWEWTSTIYDPENYPYPYTTDDGREDANSTNFRVLRGGSFGFYDFGMRSAYRHSGNPDSVSDYNGFRCARSYQE